MKELEVLDREDEKSEDHNEFSADLNGEKVYTITDISTMLDKSAATIRHWEKEMKGLITVSRNLQGARVYSERQMRMFKEINQWREDGWSLENIYKVLNSTKTLYETGEHVNPFPTPKYDEDVLSKIEKIIERQLTNHSNNLLISDGTDEDRRSRENAEHVSRESAKRRVEARLKSRALKEWAKEPEDKRYIKSGLFRREENITERDVFIEDYIAVHFESEYRKEFFDN